MAMKKKPVDEKDIKADIKHDTMEFSAASDGDDKLDMDDVAYDEEEITAEELDILEDEADNEAMALDSVETDRLADDDNLPEEDWTDDVADNDAEETNHQRPA
jgi:hypothetical protein